MVVKYQKLMIVNFRSPEDYHSALLHAQLSRAPLTARLGHLTGPSSLSQYTCKLGDLSTAESSAQTGTVILSDDAAVIESGVYTSSETLWK